MALLQAVVGLGASLRRLATPVHIIMIELCSRVKDQVTFLFCCFTWEAEPSARNLHVRSFAPFHHPKISFFFRSHSVDLQEDSYTRDVVNHRVVFLPFLGAGSDNSVASLLWAILDIVGPDNAGNLLVA